MRISEIRVHLLHKELIAAMHISRGGFNIRTHAIVEVITDCGLIGVGEAIGSSSLIASIIEKIKHKVIGLNPFNISSVRTHLLDSDVYYERAGSVVCAASAIEMACWDIKGKALNLPVHDLLGGKCRDSIEAYASDIYWQKDAEQMAEEARRIVGLGFQTIKAHLGVEGLRQETKRIERIRTSIGEDVDLMVDLNAGYRPLDAMQAAQEWRHFRLRWLEEPVDVEDLEGLSRVHAKAAMPIAAGENVFRWSGFKALLDRRAVDVIMPDVGRAGGLLECRNIGVLAEAAGVPVSPHNFSSGVLLAATLHLAASLPNAVLLEMDTSGNAVYEELLHSPPVLKDGKIILPDGVGLGVELKQEALEKYY